jgi:hypothetical protein
MNDSIVRITIASKEAIKTGLTKAKGKLANFASSVKKFGSRIGAGLRAARIAFLAVGAAIAKVTAMGAKFRNQMAEVSTMLGDNTKVMSSYSDEILKMSGKYGQSTETLSKGLYDILSAGVPAAEALSVLEVATKSAVAGVTDTATAVDALTTMMNSFGVSGKDAGHVADILFTIVKDGKTTFPELAESIAQLTPVANAAGLTMEETGAFIAQAVKVEKPARAMTGLAAALAQTAKRGENLTDVVKKFAGASYRTILDAGYNKRAAQMIALLASDVGGLEGEFSAFTNTVGASDAAFAKMDEVRHWPKFWAQIKAIVTRVGEALDKAFGPAITKATKAMAEFNTAGFFDALKTEVLLMASSWAKSWETVKITLAGTGKVIGASIADLVLFLKDRMTDMGRILATSSKNILSNVSGLAGALWEKMKRPWESFDPPDLKPVLDGLKLVDDRASKTDHAWSEMLDSLAANDKKYAAERETIENQYKAQVEARRQSEIAASESAADAVKKAAKEKSDAEDDYGNTVDDNIEKLNTMASTLAEMRGSVPTAGKARQLRRAIEELEGVEGLPDLNLEQLSKVKLASVTSGQVRQFVNAMKQLQGLDAVKDLNLGQFAEFSAAGFRGAETSKITRLIRELGMMNPIKDLNLGQFSALSGIDPAKIKDAVDAAKAAGQQGLDDAGKSGTDALATIAANTGKIAENTKGLNDLLRFH